MRTVLRLALATALLFTFFLLGADAEQVNNWSEGSNYPARITAIPIGSNKLTPNNPVRVGAWTVSFTRRPAIAKFDGTSGACASISTYNGEPDEGLVCTNPIVGSVPCAFVAWLSDSCVGPPGRGRLCFFFVYANDAPRLLVPCPSSLGLN